MRDARLRLGEAEEELDRLKALVSKQEAEVQRQVEKYLAAKLIYELTHERLLVDYPDVYPAWIGEPWPDPES